MNLDSSPRQIDFIVYNLMIRMKILVTAPYHEKGLFELKQDLGEVIYKPWKVNNRAYTEAELLTMLYETEAEALMKEALPMGTVQQIHGYARQLAQQKKGKEAFEAFKINYDKNPNEFTTTVGMARGYSAVGDYKKALGFAQKALPKAPDNGNKMNVERMIKTLQEGKDIN